MNFTHSIKIAPSILSADYASLRNESERVRLAGADMLHVDVMDGHFVPNITIGPAVVKSLNKATEMPLDCHLMITDPLDYVEAFAQAGADLISFHIESRSDVAATIAKIKSAGALPALVLKPGTPAEAVEPYLRDLALVLVMTVEPGFGGQKFMTDMLPKIRAIRAMADAVNPDLLLEVDGGIVPDTAKLCVEAGADVLVSGSYLFGAADVAAAVASLR
ncbi:MAG: ribulose-phosphate 3-epimerase [Clostridia bacterium]|nr:ribulose-phosphate 3-epimerase [Clostridia bacterium]